MNTSPEFWNNFLPNFWANFASDFLVGIVIVSAISIIVRKAKKIEAKVTARLVKESDSGYKLVFALKNSGKTNFKAQDVYYHIFVPAGLSPNEHGDETKRTMVETTEGGYFDFVGLLDKPCFPGRSTELCTLRISPKEPKPHSVLFFLSTAHGFFPKGIKQDQNGNVKFEKLGKVTVETA